MQQRIREAFAPLAAAAFEGPVEADETYGWRQGGQQARAQEAESGTRNGWQDGGTGQIRPRSLRIQSGPTLKQFVYNPTEIGATVYTDDATAYKGMIGMERETVKHSGGE